MVHKSNTTCSWGEAVSAEIMADIFSLVITVTFIHYWYSFFSVSSCFRFLSAVFQSDLLQHTKTFTHTHPATFPLHGLLSVSPPRVFQSSSSFWLWDHDVGNRLHQAFFLLHLSSLPHRSPSFPPFPVDVSPPSLLPLSLHLLRSPSLAPVSALFYYSFHPSLLSSASLVLLFACKEFWSLEVIRKLLQLSASFLQPFLCCSRFIQLSSSLQFLVPICSLHPYFDFFFFYWEFLWLLPLFPPICSIFHLAVGASLTV